MATWKSPLFSDIRNKLGENVVFSMWKGRPYMRSYVKPANPNSLKQRANRDHMAKIVAMFQANVKGDADAAAAWDAEGLAALVSGYNRFVQYGRKVTLGTLDLSATTISIPITASGVPADRLAVMVKKAVGGTYLLPTTKRGLGTYTESDFTDWTPAAGDLIYIVDTAVNKSGDTATTAALYKAVNNWKPNVLTGVADQMIVTA